MTITAQLSTALADRYRIERHLGAGGMATVYLAHDVKHNRKVALKVLRPELAHAIGPERFLHEIETTANLRHPHILPLYDSGRTGGRADGPADGAAGGSAEPTASGEPLTANGFLFYVMPDDLMAVSVGRGADGPAPGRPRRLFTGRFDYTLYGAFEANYDVSPDGRRFLMVRRVQSVRPSVIQVVFDWKSVLLSTAGGTP